jgi:hypothetical protein
MANQLRDLGVPLHRMRDGSVTGWNSLGMPRPMFAWSGRRTFLVGSPTICRAAAPSLAQYFPIVGIHDRDTSFENLEASGVEQYVVISDDPLGEIHHLMECGVPLDSIEILAPEFLSQLPNLAWPIPR